MKLDSTYIFKSNRWNLKQLFTYIIVVRGVKPRLSKYLTVSYKKENLQKINKASAFHFRRWHWMLAQVLEQIRSLILQRLYRSLFCHSPALIFWRIEKQITTIAKSKTPHLFNNLSQLSMYCQCRKWNVYSWVFA